MQSIETKYFGPTNTRGSRVQVRTESCKKVISWDHSLDSKENHVQAAIQAAKEWQWIKPGDKVVYGGKADGTGYNVNIVCDYSTIEVK